MCLSAFKCVSLTTGHFLSLNQQSYNQDKQLLSTTCSVITNLVTKSSSNIYQFRQQVDAEHSSITSLFGQVRYDAQSQTCFTFKPPTTLTLCVVVVGKQRQLFVKLMYGMVLTLTLIFIYLFIYSESVHSTFRMSKVHVLSVIVDHKQWHRIRLITTLLKL